MHVDKQKDRKQHRTDGSRNHTHNQGAKIIDVVSVLTFEFPERQENPGHQDKDVEQAKFNHMKISDKLHQQKKSRNTDGYPDTVVFRNSLGVVENDHGLRFSFLKFYTFFT